jgi:hypothetical protein
MKGATTEEFLTYVKGLNFYELEDMCAFVRAYVDAYYKSNTTDKELLKEAYMQYSIVAAEFIPLLLSYVEQVIELRKVLEDARDREAVQHSN